MSQRVSANKKQAMTPNMLGAIVLALAFFVLFALSGVSASTTLKETTVSTYMPLPQLFFSLSSASILLIPVALVCMVCALIALLGRQRNVAMMFSIVAFLSFGLFLFLFSREQMNSALYTPLSEALKEAGIKFKKRDVKSIDTSFSPGAFIALAAAGLAAFLCMPKWGKEQERQRVGHDLLPYAYIAPHLIFFIIFFITPAVYGVYAAFTKWDLFNEPVFIGLENFKTMLFDSQNTYYRQLRNGLWNTVKFVLYSVPFCIAVPLVLALALHTKAKGSKFFQAVYYFPSLLSITTVTLSWRYMFSPDYGVMNRFFGSRSRLRGRSGFLAEVPAYHPARHAVSPDVHLRHLRGGPVQHLWPAPDFDRLRQPGSQRRAADVHSGKRREKAGGRYVRRHGAGAGPVHHDRFLLPAEAHALQRA